MATIDIDNVFSLTKERVVESKKLTHYYAFPTPSKKYPTASRLEHRINKFFDPDYSPSNKKDMQNGRESILDLAWWLGFKSRPELMKAAYDSSNPELARLILAAIDRINERFERSARQSAIDADDSKLLLEWVKRDDSIMEKANPELSKDANTKLQIKINISRDERINEAIKESMQAIDAEFKDVLSGESDLDDSNNLLPDLIGEEDDANG